jgi:hypothetical protein
LLICNSTKAQSPLVCPVSSAGDFDITDQKAGSHPWCRRSPDNFAKSPPST